MHSGSLPATRSVVGTSRSNRTNRTWYIQNKPTGPFGGQPSRRAARLPGRWWGRRLACPYVSGTAGSAEDSPRLGGVALVRPLPFVALFRLAVFSLVDVDKESDAAEPNPVAIVERAGPCV